MPYPDGLEGKCSFIGFEETQLEVRPGCRVACRAGIGWQVWQEAQSLWRVTMYPGTCQMLMASFKKPTACLEVWSSASLRG